MNALGRRLRLTAIVALASGLLALAVYWSHRDRGFATPTDCLCAYYEACQDGDLTKYLSCLADPLRFELRRSVSDGGKLAALLRQQAVKNWVVVAEQEGEKPLTSILIDEVRADSIRRVRFRLEHAGGSWVITAVDTLKEKRPPIRFGTDVRNVPNDRQSPGESPPQEE